MATDVIHKHPDLHMSATDRTQLQTLMQRRGLLVEPSPATRASAAQSTLTLEEAAAMLSRGDAPPFSAQLAEARGHHE